MAKIYLPPKEFEVPDFISFLRKSQVYLNGPYEKACDKYVEDIKAWLKKCYGSACKEAGEEISFSVGDGKALYMVVTLKPVVLLHIPLGDAYEFQYAHRLTASDVRKEIKIAKATHEMFSKKRRTN